MKKNQIGITLLAIVFMMMLSSCQKEPVNSLLEQHWLLDRFTILSTQEVVQCERLFYGITYMVTEVTEKQGTHDYGSYIARTEYPADGSLVLKDFKVRHSTGDSGIAATSEQLKPFGINNPDMTVFQILQLTDRKLVLQSDYARLELTKF